MKSEVVLLTKAKHEIDIIGWVEHYKECGFDHILIFDNDSCSDLSKVFQNESKVTVKSIHGFPNQLKLYTEAYNDNIEYDWQLYVDDDEYLWFDKTKWKNINEFLESIPRYIKQYGVFWEFISSRTFEKERSTYEIPMNKYYTYISRQEYKSHIKSFVRKGLDVVFYNPHGAGLINVDIVALDAMTEAGMVEYYDKPFKTLDPHDFSIKLFHYYVQSEKEYSIKMNQLLPDHINPCKRTHDDECRFFNYNEECLQIKDF